MSAPFPGRRSSPSATMPRTMSSTSSGWGRMAALMHTMPAISGCRAANQIVREPPIDWPATTTWSQRVASRW